MALAGLFSQSSIQECSKAFVNHEQKNLLFSYFILETSIVGKLSKINPFDQPAVEEGKRLTRQFLSEMGFDS